MPADTGHSQQITHSRAATLRLLQVTAVLSVLALVFQFVTAGQILSDNQAAIALHGSGAIAVHVILGLTMLAAAGYWWRHHRPWWPTVLAAVMFVLSFVQARLGDAGMLAAHVPTAIVLTIGVVWVAAWAFSRGARHH
jgi:hypothetical protein